MKEVGKSEISTIRKFNRFYTNKIGVLGKVHLESPYSLTESRVLYEIANGKDVTASDIGRVLELDAGYLSRLLTKLTKQGLVSAKRSPVDGRQINLLLTKKGQLVFLDLDERANKNIGAMLSRLTAGQETQLVAAMQKIETIIDPEASSNNRVPYLIRNHQPGDMGWVVHRQGILYAEEYGWDEQYEALVAEIVAHFIRNFDPKRERCWIAERKGQIVGSVFLVKKSDTVAKLRLLYVEPSARGMGIGQRLVSECTRFARQTGYKKIVLWTQSMLSSARKIYHAEGYGMVKEEPHHSFGRDLVAETWELKL